MPEVLNLTGRNFGRLTVIERAPQKLSGNRYRVAWHCVCQCGNKTIITADNLLRPRAVRSCGCLHLDVICIHHASEAPEYRVWAALLNRCYNQRHKQFRHYGGRGITVCDRWRFGENGQHPFICFLADVGHRPSPKLSIDRIDNNDGYHPDNVRWATSLQQARNRRRYKGISEMVETLGITRRQAIARMQVTT